MSTNYYAFGPFPGGEATDPDGSTREGLHIGQRAGGSRFLFASHPGLGLTTYKAWSEFIRRPDVTIRAESGYEVTVEEMDETMTERLDACGWPRRHRFDSYTVPRLHTGDHVDPDGNHAFHEGYFC